jgi:GTP-binding protein HflX
MRAERERTQLPTIAIAGYTNAGKSTLLNSVSGADVEVRDRLFHTLDPATRTATIAGRTYLVTDTVGFIRKLPHQLVDAFGATLVETKRADAIVHVADASAPEEELVEMVGAVEEVLEEIGAGANARVLALNKVDLVDDERRRELTFRHPDAVQVSAATGEGLDALAERVEAEFARVLRVVELLVPYGDGALLPELHQLAGDLEREETAEGVLVRARLPAAAAERFERFAVSNGAG